MIKPFEAYTWKELMLATPLFGPSITLLGLAIPSEVMCLASNLIGLDLDRTANFGDPHLTEPAACLRLIRALSGNENLSEPMR